jgi:hypothetical protein
VPPTSTVQPAAPGQDGSTAGLAVLVGLLAGAMALVQVGRRRRSAQR